MELDEAIKYYEETADKWDHNIGYLENAGLPKTAERYKDCIQEYRQLVKWLKELKELRGESNG